MTEPTSGLTPAGLRRLRDTNAPATPERTESASGLTRAGLRRSAGIETTAAPLTTQQRKKMRKSDFVFPDKAPGPGSYPIQSRKQGGVALSLSSGTPQAAAVKRAVCSRYPDLPACQGG